MSCPLIILGSGGGAHDVLDIVDALNARSETWRILGFLDDARPSGSEHLGLQVLGRLSNAVEHPEAWFVNTIGSDRNHGRRKAIVGSTGVPVERFATLVHPSASVSPRARVGRGVTLGASVVVGGGVEIGDHVTLCPGVVIGHDVTIEAHALIAPGAIISGHVRIGEGCYIGAGALIRQCLAIGPKALVGMGAVVTRDVESGSIVIGCPARPIDTRCEENESRPVLTHSEARNR